MKRAPTYYSLNIGVVYVDEDHYAGSLRSFPCCQTDALAMKQMALILGYDHVETLLNEAATVENVKAKLRTYSKTLKAGDFLLISYSGHGGQMSKLAKHVGPRTKEKNIETWCLYDRQLLDKELPELWANFEEGVTIVLVMDSCHGGGAARKRITGKDFFQGATKVVDKNAMQTILNKGKGTAVDNNKLYTELREKYTLQEHEVNANFLQLAACKANQYALARPFMSKYTWEFLNLLGEKSFKNYPTFHDAIVEQHKRFINEDQNPVYKDEVFDKKSDFFAHSPPFSKLGQAITDEQLSQIKKLTSYNQDQEIVVESTNDLLLDATDLSAGKFNQNKDWQPLSSNKKSKSQLFTRTYKNAIKDTGKAWDRAYRKYLELERKGTPAFIEPAFREKIKDAKAYQFLSKNSDPFLQRWPQPKQNKFSWFLEKEYSQLKDARQHVIDYLAEKGETPKIRIAHIDTGIRYNHIAFQGLNINKALAKSFIPGEGDNPAVDILARERKGRIVNWEAIQRKAEQDFHGTATLAILAGGHIPKEHAYDNFEGEIGGIPFAEIIPIRISETVALTGLMFNVKEFAQAVMYAVEDCQCNVISMSMAGSPSRAWAKVVNYAYENGCVIVSAGGNSWRPNDTNFNWRRPVRSVGRAIGNMAQSIIPKKLMYPARFARVIAATGVCANHQPYNFDNIGYQKTAGGEFMQGNYGPQWAMDYAVAGYTPNIPWAELNEQNQSVFLRSGGGTSSATPQVAAAAALYMAKNRQFFIDNYGRQPNWRWTEATRQALFNSASIIDDKTQKYLGMGELKAMDALNEPLLPANKLKKNEKEAKIFSGFFSFVKMAFGKSADYSTPTTLKEMMELEILQILHRDSALMEYAVQVEEEVPSLTTEQLEAIFNQVKASRFASDTFKKYAYFQK